MLNIVCVNAGDYQGCGAKYVGRLHDSLKRNCSIPYKFSCFTDDYADDFYYVGIDRLLLPDPSLKGWWAKMGLFKPGVFEHGERVLYIDLSTQIRHNIDALATLGDAFVMVQPTGYPGPFGGLQSSVMFWEASGETDALWASYEGNGKPQDWPGGDQAFIEAFGPYAYSWDELVPGSVRSWKLSDRGDDPAIAIFHGTPKPHTLPGWPGEIAMPHMIDAIAPARFVDVCNTPASDIAENVRANTWRDIPRVRSRIHGAVVVGGGPSAADYIEEIRAKQRDGAAVFSLNGAAQWLRANGVTPDFHVLLDARRENITFLSHAMENEAAGARMTVYLLAAQCHPDLFAFLSENGCDVRLWHVDAGDDIACSTKQIEPNAHLVSIGTTVGLSVLNLILMMGYRRADLYGYDSSAAGRAHHAYSQPLNDGALTDEYIFNGKVYDAPRAMASQAKAFLATYQRIEAAGLAITVRGGGLLPDMWRNEEAARAASQVSLEAREAYKYRRCWQTDVYREWSDGENLVGRALDLLLPDVHLPEEISFIDFGCGSGRATAKLQAMGYSVLGVDHAANCLDTDVHIPLCVANLWSIPSVVNQSDFGYCVDVMEHIPEDKIDIVLSKMKELCSKAVFFKIDHNGAIFGDILGVGTLHNTIRDPEWWRVKLAGHFPGVRHNQREGWFICYNGKLVSA
jgi:SAM-dependent methyltransferase